MKLNVKIFLGMGMVVLILWLFLSPRPGTQQQRPIVSASQSLPTPPTDNRHADTIVTVPPRPPASQLVEGTSVNLKSYLISQHPAAIESRLDKRDAFLSRYRLLGQKKVLLTTEETKELKALLNDSEKRNFYQNYLKSVELTTHAAADEQMYRLFALQFLESSWVSSKDADILDFFVEFVLQDNFYADLSIDSKKFLAYEKIKILDFLKKESPASLDIIKHGMPGLRHEKLLRNYFDKQPEA